ncbi:LOW QUALITY PROTEIN: hypothetical protein IFM46972_02534 [Aspergillus udagawae]|uniref:Uncharacterized protein n=1 Tax=Aspergillus udagawae TaxID=91492 RepID=A0A8H3RL85_9EURO|nr:LOW QUALITY PROTEIN: hypothetical protein IFM46972_02534 [Aspergillus udagawae]
MQLAIRRADPLCFDIHNGMGPDIHRKYVLSVKLLVEAVRTRRATRIRLVRHQHLPFVRILHDRLDFPPDELASLLVGNRVCKATKQELQPTSGFPQALEGGFAVCGGQRHGLPRELREPDGEPRGASLSPDIGEVSEYLLALLRGERTVTTGNAVLRTTDEDVQGLNGVRNGGHELHTRGTHADKTNSLTLEI